MNSFDLQSSLSKYLWSSKTGPADVLVVGGPGQGMVAAIVGAAKDHASNLSAPFVNVRSKPTDLQSVGFASISADELVDALRASQGAPHGALTPVGILSSHDALGVLSNLGQSRHSILHVDIGSTLGDEAWRRLTKFALSRELAGVDLSNTALVLSAHSHAIDPAFEKALSGNFAVFKLDAPEHTAIAEAVLRRRQEQSEPSSIDGPKI